MLYVHIHIPLNFVIQFYVARCSDSQLGFHLRVGGVTFIFNSPKLKSFSVKNCGICFYVLCCFIFLAKTISCVCLENNIFSCGAHFISTQYIVLYSFHKYNMLWYVLGLVLSCGVCVWSCGLWLWFVVLVLCFLWSVGVVWCCLVVL